ncbi:hypothetical protein TSUD_34550 [Trifolium subterraneum]|uniref:Uncharacterized protein n=1 Tax=Trifolium subterraneum TaxID=3900 RepID=A0A2Z6NGD8_TRISU|nr:hypothetical protein TSUD_34550 [Trifolium subterraneum]
MYATAMAKAFGDGECFTIQNHSVVWWQWALRKAQRNTIEIKSNRKQLKWFHQDIVNLIFGAAQWRQIHGGGGAGRAETGGA